MDMDLFEQENNKEEKKELPLAARMRPRNLKEFLGQKHILGEGKLLRRCIEADRINSLILYGPPGTGKTTLGYVISNITDSHFSQLNAVSSNVKQIRKIVSEAKNRKKLKQKDTILFIDEIHRFNKAQQDVLIPEVEKASIILIGATTHNPFFSIVSPLISRSMVFELNPLEEEEIKDILKQAMEDERGLEEYNVKITSEALDFIVAQADGDARRALNALEIGVITTPPDESGVINFDVQVAQECMQKKLIRYDQDEDHHYDVSSAYIKSIRGSDPDAAVYWLAKMLYAGEDPLFIARRLVISAAEDIGNADVGALNVANSTMQITQFIGMPECQIPLAQATLYLACAPKSNASCKAINKAMKDVKQGKSLEVPDHLKDSHYSQAEQLGHGEGYKYSHDYKDHYVQQEYKPSRKKYYFPTKQGAEEKFFEKLEEIRSEEG